MHPSMMYIAQQQTQKALDNIYEWMEKWKTKISTGKTHYLVIDNSKKRINKTDLILQYNEQQILQKAHPKLLGYYLDEQLNYRYHLTQITGKLNNKLRFLFSLKGTDWGSNEVTLKPQLIRP
eukprot:Pgem_evm1s1364